MESILPGTKSVTWQNCVERFFPWYSRTVTALNPTMTIGRQIEEAIKIHNPHIKRDALEKRVIELMGLVGIDQADERRNLYPYHFSGGMRQLQCVSNRTGRKSVYPDRR